MLVEDRLSASVRPSEIAQLVTGSPRRPTEAQRAWVTAVLGVPMASPSPVPAAPSSLAENVARLKSLRDEAVLHGVMDGFRDALQQAAIALKAGDAGAIAQIEALESRMAATAAAQRAKEAEAMADRLKTASGMGTVAFNKLRLQLNDARARFFGAVDSLKAACEALIKTEDFLNDPRSSDPATHAAIDALDQRLPSIITLIEGLDDALDLMIQATDPAVRDGHVKQALQAIDAYRLQIDAVPLLTMMEHTEAGDFAIHSAMTAILDELAAALRG
jgi:hypothetical protein